MKYIIEIAKEYEGIFKGVLICGIVDGKFAVDVIAREDLEELNSDYINEHFGDMQDTAYQRGLEEGKKATWELVADASNAEYQKGLNDAWECARKLFSSMADSDIEKAFSTEWNNGGFHALINLQPQEAIAKLKAYEEKQKAEDKIKVGDEVDWSGDKFIVTRIFQPYDNAEECDGVDMDGCTYHDVLISGLTKTGRHVDITDMLKGALE